MANWQDNRNPATIEFDGQDFLVIRQIVTAEFDKTIDDLYFETYNEAMQHNQLALNGLTPAMFDFIQELEYHGGWCTKGDCPYIDSDELKILIDRGLVIVTNKFGGRSLWYKLP